MRKPTLAFTGVILSFSSQITALALEPVHTAFASNDAKAAAALFSSELLGLRSILDSLRSRVSFLLPGKALHP
jgi:hypothetical protein